MISIVLNIVEVHPGMLINLVLFDDSSCLFAKWAPETSIFHMVYKVLGCGFPHVANHCFTNGFLDLSG